MPSLKSRVVAEIKRKVSEGGRATFEQKRYALELRNVDLNPIKNGETRRFDVSCCLVVLPFGIECISSSSGYNHAREESNEAQASSGGSILRLQFLPVF